MTDGIWECEDRYLKFSCQSLELSVKPRERAEGSFQISTGNDEAKGEIYSSDTRMQSLTTDFSGREAVIEYCFLTGNLEPGSQVHGEFTVISSEGEYTLPYQINVQKPQLESSMGSIRNLFHFANLAKANWAEAVELFYSPEFITIFHKNDKNLETIYLGLSRNPGNEENVEEFLIETNKKTAIEYHTDMEGFMLENVMDSQVRTLAITRSGWGYLRLQVRAEGSFLTLEHDTIMDADFEDDLYRLNFTIDATKLRHGINKGRLIIEDTCYKMSIPIQVMMQEGGLRAEQKRQEKRAVIALMKNYIELKFHKITRNIWVERAAEAIGQLQDLNPDDLMTQLYQVQILTTRERYNEARYWLDKLEPDAFGKESDMLVKCYYLYLETLLNKDESYLQAVTDEIEQIYRRDETQWYLAWFLLYLDQEYIRNPEARWNLLEKQFKLGCSSPILFCEAVLLFQSHPSFILELGQFEQNVIWYAAKYQMLDANMIEQVQYLCARLKTYSNLLFRTLCEVYRTNQSPQTITAICRLLILGEKQGAQYFQWYALGVANEVRVTRLYEYYMMSLDIRDKTIKLPKMVLMYFAYQSNLDYEHNAYLYAYVVRNRDKNPDLERNYRIAMERFVVDQIRLGHMNEDLAFLYENILAPQMLRDDTAYAFAPLLFMHRITVDNPKITSVVVVYEKINGENSYPVTDCTCLIPVYGSEYQLFLQDAEGSRFTRRVAYINRQLMQTDRLLSFVGPSIEGRLSFDMYLCEQDANYVTITQDNVFRFKHLAESEQVIESFKKEIRVKLLRFYYENDMIGELDTYLDEIEADTMESDERAEFIRFLISRGMFDKAYQWVKRYGMSGVNMKSIARLISKRIVASKFTREDFLINVSYYIYKNMKYDENILQYLMMYYEGQTTHLRNIWKSAVELELPVDDIMHRILGQMRFTHVIVPEKDEILLSYAVSPEHDDTLVQELLDDAAYAYFVQDAITDSRIFDQIYIRYRKSGEAQTPVKLALLKFWSENPEKKAQVARDIMSVFVGEFLRKGIYFPFFKELSDQVVLLHYYRNKYFVEYRTRPDSKVRIHYFVDSEKETNPVYEVEEMKDMYEGIHVKDFCLFQGEVLQYYVTETLDGNEQITQSGTLTRRPEDHVQGRFGMLNDIMVSMSLHDEITAQKVMEEYMEEDYSVRELFRVL